MRLATLVPSRRHTRRRARFISLVFAAITALTFTLAGCKSEPAMPPDPTKIINGVRDQLTPFRFTLATEPTVPNYHAPILLKVHVIDATGQPADGLTLKSDVSMSGMENDAKHLTLNDKGSGNYEGEVNLEMGGSWDVGLTATKDGKSGQRKLSIEVGG